MDVMTPRQRVLAALNGKMPDRIPWVENAIDEPFQVALMGETNFTPGDLCRKLGMDGFGGTFPIVDPNYSESHTSDPVQAFYYPTKVNFDFFNVYIAETELGAENTRSFYTKRLLDSEDSLRLFDEFLPDPDYPSRYERVSKWIAQYRDDFAVHARLDIGAGATLQSMGLEQFSFALMDNPKLIHKIHERFSDWAARTIRHLNEMDFDFFWIMDDLAWNQRPMVSPQVFREFFLPHMREAVNAIKKPWVFHSDGNILPLMDDLLELGMNAVHPIQPGAMDIEQIKARYGKRICLIGNIDLHYTLTRGLPLEVEEEVKNRIRIAGKDGAYIISSAMTITDYCKQENVIAMSNAIQMYGHYPLK